MRQSARYELLDPLRGLAIIAVMLLHFCERGTHSGDVWVHARIWPVVQHGYLGVQLFFIISGYCICAALYGAMKQEKPFRYFMWRRLRRIFPPYWASMLFVVLLGCLTIAILGTPRETVFPLSSLDWLWNVLLLQGPTDAQAANLVYWSLSIELQFYFVMAIALIWMPWTEVWLIGFSLLSLALHHGPARIDALPSLSLWGTIFAYWSEFVCGIVAYYWLTGNLKSRSTPWILIALVLVDIALRSHDFEQIVQSNGRFTVAVKLVFCLGCLVLLLVLRPFDDVLCRNKAVRVLGLFGIVSYSIYLTHVPIGTRLFNITERLISLDGFRWLIPFAGAMIVGTLFGIVFFQFLEKPWLNPTGKSGS